MEMGEFESLSKKVEEAVSLIEELKREREALKDELRSVQERAARVGEQVRDLVSRLDTALV